MSDSKQAARDTTAESPVATAAVNAGPAFDGDRIQDQAKARCVVAEYLRDLGLRDPDVIALESQRIVTQALQEVRPDQYAVDESLLCEKAILLTVKQLERWLEVLATQSGRPDPSPRLGSVIAARLPDLLSRFPQALHGGEMPAELVHSLQDGLTPVVPPPRPRGMRRQVLPLIPSSFKRLGSQIRKLLFGGTS